MVRIYQHGSDSFIAERVCDPIEEAAPCIVLPTMHHNICAMMKSYPSVISIPPDVMTQMYDCTTRFFGNARETDSRKVLPPFATVARRHPCSFWPIWSTSARQPKRPESPPSPTITLSSKTLSAAGAEEYAKDSPVEVGHGGEIETALNLASRPEFVHLDRLTEDGPTNPRAVSGNYHIDWINQVPLGYVGNPRLASQDAADKFMDAVAANFIKVASEFAAYRIGIDV